MKALILGPTGRASRAVAGALKARGWECIPFRRGKDDLEHMARDLEVIVYGWNPPQQDWARQYPSLTDQVLRAAKINNAMIFFPGNVYVYGNAPSPWSENTPHVPVNSLGQIRADIEAKLNASDVQTLILRAGDFIDTEFSGNWFDSALIKNLDKGKLSYPGTLNAPHAWAYLPDYGKAAAMLISKRHELAQHETVNFAGYNFSGLELAETLSQVTGKPISTKNMSWTSAYFAAPFVPFLRKLIEMRYLWNTPHQLDGAHMRMLLSEYEDTDLNEALTRAIAPLQAREQSSKDKSRQPQKA